MKRLIKKLRGAKKENGAIMVMTAILLVVLISFAAIAIDFGLHYYNSARLQNAVDAAATAVAGNIGSADTSFEDIAYEYMKLNGFDHEGKYKDKLEVTVEKKGVVDMETLYSDGYITTGYFKVTAKLDDPSVLAQVLGYTSFGLTKVSYVRCQANYVDMPRALNYTIFAGSSNGTAQAPAMQINGRTNWIFNRVVGFVESGINIINSALVQPIIGFFGGTPNYNDLVHINLSEVVSNGDMHSNSNIGVGVQALNVARIKDRDFNGEDNLAAYQNMDDEVVEYETGYNDYGQVTLTAVKDINFNYKNAYSNNKTRIYIQNQQYIEQTQMALSIVDLLDFGQITSTQTLRQKYQEAAELYVEKQFNLTNPQKNAIYNQKDKLEYVGPYQFKLTDQPSIVYNINANTANSMLDYAEQNGIDALYQDLESLGNDNPTAVGLNYYDSTSSTAQEVVFNRFNEDGSLLENAVLNINGTNINRDYSKISNLTSATRAGVRFAVARTFQENSEYIDIPNLKPYFTRAINKSVKNATKTREKINQSDAGQTTVKKAVKAKNDELKGYLENLSFEDSTYADSNTYLLKDKTVLFKTFKPSSESGIINLGNDVKTYNRSTREGYNYSFSISEKTYKGYNLYDANNVLKAPGAFVQEFKTGNSVEFAQNALTAFRTSVIEDERTKVSTKKNVLLNNAQNVSDYDARKNSAYESIEAVPIPEINGNGSITIENKVNVTPVAPKDVFLGYGTTGNGENILRTDAQRTIFDNFIKDLGVTVSNDTYTIPAFSTAGMTSKGQLGGKGCSSDQYFQNNCYYSNATTPYKQVIVVTGRYNLCIQNATSVVTGDVTVDEGIALDVKSGGVLKVGGSIRSTGGNESKIYVRNGGTLYVRGDIIMERKDKIYVEAGGKLIVQGQITAAGSNSGEINNYGTLIQLNGSNTVNASWLRCYAGSILGSVGGLNSSNTIYLDGSTVYTLKNISGNNDGNGTDLIDVKGNCNIYVNGCLTSGSSNLHLYTHDGSNSVISILGQGYTDCFNGKIRQLWDAATGTQIYLGKATTITNDSNKDIVYNGSIYCFGDFTINTSNTITATGSGVTYVAGNFSIPNGSLVLNNGHTVYATGTINIRTLTLNGSKIHSDAQITGTTLTLNNSSEVEGIQGTEFTNVTNNGGTIYEAQTVNFETDNIKVTGLSSYVYTGNITRTTMTLKNSNIKIVGNVTLTGALSLTNTKLVIEGTLTCGAVTGSASGLYVNNNTTTGAITLRSSSTALVRKNSGNANLTSSGIVYATGSSNLYVDGKLSATGYHSEGLSKILGYESASLTSSTAYADGSYVSAYAVDAAKGEIFCGSDTTTAGSVGIIANGRFSFPGKAVTSNKLYIKSTGKVVFGGSDGQNVLTVDGYFLIEGSGDNKGELFCPGKTVVKNCSITNSGRMYLLGGTDYSNGSRRGKVKTKDNLVGTDEYTFYCDMDLLSGSESYFGRSYNDANGNGNFTFQSQYESRGDVYFEDNLIVNGYIENGDKNFDTTGSTLDMPNRGTAIYIPSGITYTSGSVSAGNDNAIYIQDNGGLVMKNDLNYGCVIYNYGKLHICDGNLNLRSSATWVTDKKEQDKQNQGMSIKNGRDAGSNAEFFVGGSNALDFVGYIRNCGKLYLNSTRLNIKGFSTLDNISGDVAYMNLEGGQTYVNGPVRLNSNQLVNRWKYNGRDAVFACKGKLTYGGCVYNCGKLLVEGAITNNESTSETVNSRKYLADTHFSVMNGYYMLKKVVRESYNSYSYPDATIYCEGDMQVGVSEVGGESGSIISCGTMYVGGNVDIFTNANSFKVTLTNLASFWNNPESHSYFRTAFWMYNNSNTFVGGDFFAGAGVAIGRDSIFMCGGDYRSKRSTKIGVEMFMGTSVFGSIGIQWIQDLLSDYMTYTDTKTTLGTDTAYDSAYFYVGGNALINTIGSTVKSFGVVTAPENNTRDMDIYANTNMYVGGTLYANCKVYMKENVCAMVAAKKSLYDSNGKLSSLVYQPLGDLVVPEKQLTNGVPVYTYLTQNKNCKFYIHQCLDMYPCSKLIVKGGMKVRDTAKIRDMTKVYLYGDFEGDEYVEIGKSLDGKDQTAILNASGATESVARDGSGNPKFLTEAEKTKLASIGETKFVQQYDFDNSAYMYVGGNFTSGSSGIIDSLLNGKIFQIFTQTLFSTGYTKVFASSTLKVQGNVTSNKYITLRHDARIYSGGDMTAKTSIEGGNYTEFYVGGDMNAGSSPLTTIVDTLDILDLSNRGTITLMEQARAIVGGNMFSTKHIQLGELASGSYTRGRKTNYGVSTVTDGSESNYGDDDFTEKTCPECGASLDDAEIQNMHCQDCNKDFTFDNEAGDDQNGTTQTVSDAQTIDTSTELENEEDDAYGANVFVQGSMVALNGHIKEFAYTCCVVGKYVYAPDYITLRSNADLWVLPEVFGSYCPHCEELLTDEELEAKHCDNCNKDFRAPGGTYQYLPYDGVKGSTLFSKILYYIRKAGYEVKEALKFKNGSIYTLHELTLNKNASLLGTYDCYVPGQCILRKDSLVYLGHDFTCTAPAMNLSISALKGENAITGFDSVGEAHPGWQYTCKNKDAHDGYWYTMTTRSDETIDGTLVCDECGEPIDLSTKKKVQVSYPCVVYANHDINILTTIDMQMTYLITNKGKVNLYNLYTRTKWNESNAKDLPNAIASYQNDIDYFALYGKLSSLFYAPNGNIDFDGWYSEIWGCVLGDTVEMNCYYQAFHRFNNWRTMDLHVAEGGKVFIIPKKSYDEAPDNVEDIWLDDSKISNPNLPEGAQLFFY